jgi:hypothetical protein
VIVEPVQDRLAYDIAIPITKPRLTHNVRKLSALDPATLEAIYDPEDLDEVFRGNLVCPHIIPAKRPGFVRLMGFPHVPSHTG